jgi:hypothetical protein
VIAVAPVTPLTLTGDLEPVVPSFPSCLEALSPQQLTVPSDSTAQTKSGPVVIAVAPVIPVTATGEFETIPREVLMLPQHFTAPPATMAQV